MKTLLGSSNLPAAALLSAIVALLVALTLGDAAADAAAKKACLRGKAKLEATSGDVRVVRVKAKKTSSQQTRHEKLLACWAKTGKRIVINEESDFGLDNIARTKVEIVEGRYVGVRAENEGGVSMSIVARVYDARTSKLLHTSKACDELDRGEFAGVDDVAFLDGGGMAMACNRLYLYRRADSALETLEPAGTDVRQLGVSRYSYGFWQRLFWVVGNGEAVTTKSIAL